MWPGTETLVSIPATASVRNLGNEEISTSPLGADVKQLRAKRQCAFPRHAVVRGKAPRAEEAGAPPPPPQGTHGWLSVGENSVNVVVGGTPVSRGGSGTSPEAKSITWAKRTLGGLPGQRKQPGLSAHCYRGRSYEGRYQKAKHWRTREGVLWRIPEGQSTKQLQNQGAPQWADLQRETERSQHSGCISAPLPPPTPPARTGSSARRNQVSKVMGAACGDHVRHSTSLGQTPACGKGSWKTEVNWKINSDIILSFARLTGATSPTYLVQGEFGILFKTSFFSLCSLTTFCANSYNIISVFGSRLVTENWPSMSPGTSSKKIRRLRSSDATSHSEHFRPQGNTDLVPS